MTKTATVMELQPAIAVNRTMRETTKDTTPAKGRYFDGTDPWRMNTAPQEKALSGSHSYPTFGEARCFASVVKSQTEPTEWMTDWRR